MVAKLGINYMPIHNAPHRKVSWRVKSVSKTLFPKGVPFVLAILTLALSPELALAQGTSTTGGAPGPSASAGAPGQPEELGIPLGSFRLYPTLELRGGYDTNVFAQPS